VTIARSIIGEHAADGEAESRIIGPRHKEEVDGRAVGLVGQDGTVCDARVIPSTALRTG
jgi:hypothetical protein